MLTLAEAGLSPTMAAAPSQRNRHCSGKVRYLSVEKADAAWVSLVADGADPRTLCGYLCRFCSFIHLGRSARPKDEMRRVVLPSQTKVS